VARGEATQFLHVIDREALFESTQMKYYYYYYDLDENKLVEC
jgi:hypothetical protein